MKRNYEKVPDFDDIVFANRNREYGAYDLRKRYTRITGFSILGTVIACTIITLVISLTTEPVKGTTGTERIVIVKPEPYKPPVVEVPEPEVPKGMLKQKQNLVPKVVEDTSITDVFIPLTELLVETAENGDTNNIVSGTEPSVEIIPVEKKIFIVVEEPAMYPGGDRALLEYISKNISYPEEALNNNIQGRVILKFVVTEDGSVGEIFLLKSVDPLLDKEAVRVVGTLPRFKPGKQGGTPVCVWYSVPVLFQILQ
jgi:protein TonB